jgi:hypothetical protein
VKPGGEVLHAVEWDVRSIATHGEVRRLVVAWHYSQSVPNTSTYRHGLYRSDLVLHGDAHGAALWLPPTRPAGEAVAADGWNGVLSLSRLVVDPELPTNAASFLLGRSMRLIDRERWPVLVTYADTNQGHTGAIYKATNWTCDGPVPAGDVWLDASGRQRGRKRGGRSLTVAEMRAAGLERQPSAPKIRFVHRVKSRPLAVAS